MTSASGCLDVDGGGGGDGGGGDGVGKWLSVIGLGEVWVSGGLSRRGGESNWENIWLIFWAMSSLVSSLSVGVVDDGPA